MVLSGLWDPHRVMCYGVGGSWDQEAPWSHFLWVWMPHRTPMGTPAMGLGDHEDRESHGPHFMGPGGSLDPHGVALYGVSRLVEPLWSCTLWGLGELVGPPWGNALCGWGLLGILWSCILWGQGAGGTPMGQHSMGSGAHGVRLTGSLYRVGGGLLRSQWAHTLWGWGLWGHFMGRGSCGITFYRVRELWGHSTVSKRSGVTLFRMRGLWDHSMGPGGCGVVLWGHLAAQSIQVDLQTLH